MSTKQKIINDLISLVDKNGMPPRRVEYQKIGSHSISTIKKYFGNYSKAIKEIFNLDNYGPPKRTINLCEKCNCKTTNPRFCSHSCAASINNIGVKRNFSNKVYKCGICNVKTKNRRKRCEKCKNKLIGNDGKYYLPAEINKKMMCTNDTQKYRRIREHARRMARQAGLLQKCFNCQYNIHVECAHRKAIESFNDNTLISKINDTNNLIGLCPNCHWEFDQGLLKF